MGDDLIAVRDVAAEHGKHKQTLFKVLKRLGIETTKQRAATGKNQLVAYITQDDYQRLSAEFLVLNNGADPEEGEVEGAEGLVPVEEGIFYLIQLEPDLDPGRFKVGFAASLPERLRHLRCSAPFACLVLSWPCRRLWEKTAIECVSHGCQRLHTEVFRTTSLDDVVRRCEGFFAIMPPIQVDVPNPSLQRTRPAAAPSNIKNGCPGGLVR